MSFLQKSVVVHAPLSAVYDQWTRFEEFPRFMEGVEAVERLDDTHLHWRARIGGKQVRWTAQIREHVPERTLAWESTSGARNNGRVLFEPSGDGGTRVTLEVSVEPTGVVESIGEALGVVSRRVEHDLARFKAYIEARGTGSSPQVRPSAERDVPPDAMLPPIL